jgi:hypothetical protein
MEIWQGEDQGRGECAWAWRSSVEADGIWCLVEVERGGECSGKKKTCGEVEETHVLTFDRIDPCRYTYTVGAPEHIKSGHALALDEFQASIKISHAPK